MKNPFRSSIAEHLTAGYKASLLAVCLAQLGQKAVPGGMLVSPFAWKWAHHDKGQCASALGGHAGASI